MGFRRRRWRDVAPEKDKVRVNRAIRVPEVRVVNEDGQQLGVMPTDAARDIAARIGLDLVEISPNGQPPVCKIMDYGRYKYELKKKASTQKRSQHQSQLKEIKLRPQIDEHDLDFKMKAAERFLMDGDKVKATVTFRGREITHVQVGHELLERVTKRLAEIAKPESRAQMEGRMLSMMFGPDRAAIKKIEARRAAEAAKQAKLDAEAGIVRAEPEPELEEPDVEDPDLDEADLDEPEGDEEGSDA
ncbi:MAG TPA: translation initiation factor IF-3 [Myxococcota bacterium]|nr:translation initiation factor IF-3 [Myxococcota bacterium]